MEKQTMEVRWGILAPGTIARQFAHTLQDMKGEAVLAGAASRTWQRAQDFCAEFGGKPYGSYQELLASPDIDIVYVASPHSLHYEQVKMALEAGKPVLCEKSFTTDANLARELFALAKEKHQFLMEAFWTKFIPVNQQLMQLVQAGEIGEVRSVQAQYGYRTARHERKMDPALAGGALLDIGVYCIGFAAMMLGYQPQRICSTVMRGAQGTDEMESMLLDYGGGRTALLISAIGTHIPLTASVYGSDGWVEVPEFKNPQRAVVHKNDGSSYEISLPLESTGFEYQIREACRCVQQGRIQSGIMTPENSIATMAIMDELRRQWGMKFPFEQSLPKR